MKASRHIAALILLGLAPGLAAASATRPLRLELPAAMPSEPAAARPAAFASEPTARNARAAPLFRRDGTPVQRAVTETRARSLRRQALENVIDPAYANPEPDRAEGSLQLKFNKRGNAVRDLGRGYREMCDRVSAKIWDDPNGKRIRFDVAGKPGIGIEIPVGHRRR